MEKEINFAIGFITGRPNVCKIINTYSKYLVEQVKELDTKVNFTIFVLFDQIFLFIFYNFTKNVFFLFVSKKSSIFANNFVLITNHAERIICSIST